MNGKTHLILGIATGMAISNSMGIPLPVGAAMGAVGGLLPDIDHPRSYISSFIPFGWLASGVIGGHRGITHSLVAVVLGALAAKQVLPNDYLIVIVSAYLSHLVADMCTPAGVPLLLPIRFRFKLLPQMILQYVDFVLESVALIGGLLGIFYLLAQKITLG